MTPSDCTSIGFAGFRGAGFDETLCDKRICSQEPPSRPEYLSVLHTLLEDYGLGHSAQYHDLAGIGESPGLRGLTESNEGHGRADCRESTSKHLFSPSCVYAVSSLAKAHHPCCDGSHKISGLPGDESLASEMWIAFRRSLQHLRQIGADQIATIVQLVRVAAWAVGTKLLAPPHHSAIASILLNQLGHAVATFAAAPRAFDSERVQLAVYVSEGEIVADNVARR
jgi:hypothetical protein